MSHAPAQTSSAAAYWMAVRVRRRLDDASQRVRDFEQRVGEREDAGGARLLLRSLKLMVAQARGIVEENLRQANEHPHTRELKMRTVRRVLVHLEQMLGPALEMLIAPPGHDVTCLVQPYVRLARAVVDSPGAELIFETFEGFNYQVVPDVFAEMREHVGIVAPALRQTVADLPAMGLISYPSRADSDTFLHAVVAHEVAHLALVAPLSVAFDQTAATIEMSSANDSDESGDFDHFLVDALKSSAYYRDLSKKNEARDREMKRMLAWFHELVCDLIAVRLIGPAYLLALTEFLLPTHSVDEPDRTRAHENEDQEDDEDHPAPAWRLSRLKDEVLSFFVDHSQAPEVSDARTAVCRYFALQPVQDIELSEDERERRKVLERAVTDLYPYVDQMVGRGCFSAATFQRDLPLIWSKLNQGIPPAERVRERSSTRNAPGEATEPASAKEQFQPGVWSEPIDWRSILNGGYLYFLHHARQSDSDSWRELPDLNPEDRHRISAEHRRRGDRDYLSSITRGAIELSELHRQMIEMRFQFNELNSPDGSLQ